MRIALIEDMEDIRALIDAIVGLEPDHELAVHFASARQALDWTGWDSVDAAIVDWRLDEDPGLDGGDVIRWLQEHHPHVASIVLTAQVGATYFDVDVPVVDKANLVGMFEELQRERARGQTGGVA